MGSPLPPRGLYLGRAPWLAPSRSKCLSLVQVTCLYSPQNGCDSVNLPFASCLDSDQPSRPILTSHARARDTKVKDSLKCSGYFSKDMQRAKVLWAYSPPWNMNFCSASGKGLSQ